MCILWYRNILLWIVSFRCAQINNKSERDYAAYLRLRYCIVTDLLMNISQTKKGSKMLFNQSTFVKYFMLTANDQ